MLLTNIIIFCIRRQTSNEAKKQEKMAIEKAELTNNLAEMTFRLERQDAQLRELTRVLADIGKSPMLSFVNICCIDFIPFKCIISK